MKLVLWATPRSVSTAFEVMMRERGDFDCLHEPFVPSYYSSCDRQVILEGEGEGNPDFDYAVVQEVIRGKGEKGAVFFKELAYTVAHRGLEPWLKELRHTFLIRHPRLSLPSLYAKMPHFSDDEYGMKALFQMFKWSLEMGQDPVVVDAERLTQSPQLVVSRYCEQLGIPFIPEALQWEAKVRPELGWWENGRWHDKLSMSQGFSSQRREGYVPVEDNPRLRALYEESLPLYQQLLSYAIKV